MTNQKQDFKASGTLVPKVFASRRLKKLIILNVMNIINKKSNHLDFS